MADGQVTFLISVDSSKASRAIDGIVDSMRDAGVEVDRVTQQMSQSAEQSAADMTKSFNSAFNMERVKNFALSAAKTLIDFGEEAVNAASDLEEVQNVVDVTFGESAGIIDKWAKNAGKQFGLTETQAKKFTSTLGAMMKSAGMAGPEITQMSTDLAGLAADMVSFYNLDFDTAFQKIRAGISGETEPLKQLGINLSVANLEAFALAQGLDKTFNEMSQSEQIVLRYQYMMQATADAQGDFARTSDGFANATRKFETNWESLKTNIGTALIPVVADVIGFINQIVEALQTDLPEQTVLDEFAAIDLKTAEKIAQIEDTAEKARTTIGLMEEMSGVTIASANLTGFVEDLTGALGPLDEAMAAAERADYSGTLESIAKALELKTGVSADKWIELLTGVTRAINDSGIDSKKITDPIGEVKTAVNKPGIKTTTLEEAIGGAAGIINDTEIDSGNVTAPIQEVANTVNKPGIKTTTLEEAIGGTAGVINDTKINADGITGPVDDVVKTITQAEIDATKIGDAVKQVKTDVDGQSVDASGITEPVEKLVKTITPDEIDATKIGKAVEKIQTDVDGQTVDTSGITEPVETLVKTITQEEIDASQIGEAVKQVQTDVDGKTVDETGITEPLESLKAAINPDDIESGKWGDAVKALQESIDGATVDTTGITDQLGKLAETVKAGIDTTTLSENLASVQKALNPEGGFSTEALSGAIESAKTILETKPDSIGVKDGIIGARNTINNPGIRTTTLKTAINEAVQAVEAQPTAAVPPVVTAINDVKNATDKPGIDSGTLGEQVQAAVDAVQIAPAQPTPLEGAIDVLEQITANPNFNPEKVGEELDKTAQAIEGVVPAQPTPLENAIDVIEQVTASPNFNPEGVGDELQETADAIDGVVPAKPNAVVDVVSGIKSVTDKPGISGDEVQKGLDDVNKALGTEANASPIAETVAGLGDDIASAGAAIDENGDTVADWLSDAADAANKLGPEAAANFDLLVNTLGSETAGEMFKNLAGATTAVSNMAGMTNALTGFSGKGTDIQQVVENLALFGVTVNDETDAVSIWLQLCRDLVSTIPQLGQIIDTQTGEINGSTQAVKDYVDAWEELQKKGVYQSAVTQKQAALDKKFAELPMLELDMLIAKRKVQQYQDRINELVKDKGIFESADDYIGLIPEDFIDNAGWDEYKSMMSDLEQTTDDYIRAAESFDLQKAAYDEAAAALAEEQAYIDQMASSMDSATESVQLFTEAQENAASTAIGKLNPALEEMISLYESTKSGISSTVEKMFDGWDFKMPTFGDKDKPAAKGSDMEKSLQDQIKYMDEYMQLLDTLKQRGVSSDVLSTLSSGETDDLEYLRALADSSDEQITRINEQYEEAKQKREEFVNSLTETTLEGDDTWKQLSETVQSGMDSLTSTLEESGAPAAAEATMDAILEAVKSRSTAIGEEIDKVIANWQKLEGLGFGGHGTSSGGTSQSGISTDGHPLTGLDYVPFNGYMARLHEGESVLTAEQSRGWRSMLNGPSQNASGLDYGALGGVIRDNAPAAGGNVYLNGSQVGRVMSDWQADRYRDLQRSGWQG